MEPKTVYVYARCIKQNGELIYLQYVSLTESHQRACDEALQNFNGIGMRIEQLLSFDGPPKIWVIAGQEVGLKHGLSIPR